MNQLNRTPEGTMLGECCGARIHVGGTCDACGQVYGMHVSGDSQLTTCGVMGCDLAHAHPGPHTWQHEWRDQLRDEVARLRAQLDLGPISGDLRERRLQAGTQAIIQRMNRTSALNQGVTAAQWTEARILANDVLVAADAVQLDVSADQPNTGERCPRCDGEGTDPYFDGACQGVAHQLDVSAVPAAAAQVDGDLVDRLRALALGPVSDDEQWPILSDAADENERLRAALRWACTEAFADPEGAMPQLPGGSGGARR